MTDGKLKKLEELASSNNVWDGIRFSADDIRNGAKAALAEIDRLKVELTKADARFVRAMLTVGEYIGKFERATTELEAERAKLAELIAGCRRACTAWESCDTMDEIRKALEKVGAVGPDEEITKP